MRMPGPAPAFWLSCHRTFRCKTVWTWLYGRLYLLVFFIEGYLKGDFTINNCLVKSKRMLCGVIIAINAMLVIVTGKCHVEMVVAMNACYVVTTIVVTMRF